MAQALWMHDLGQLMAHPPESTGSVSRISPHRHHHFYLFQHLTNCCSILQATVVPMAMVQPMSMGWAYSIDGLSPAHADIWDNGVWCPTGVYKGIGTGDGATGIGVIIGTAV